jgi:deoxyadenosine/deoxycytidine kinase
MVHVTGPIGAGKSTLVNALSEHLQLTVLPESADRNPYLARFYEDIMSWAYAAQLWYLQEMIEQAREASRWRPQPGNAGFVWDRPPDERYNMFVPPLHELGAISKKQLAELVAMRDLANEIAPAPTLIIALRASADLLRERIRARGRDYERGLLDSTFLDEHVGRYERWWSEHPPGTLLILESSQPAAENVHAAEAEVRRRLQNNGASAFSSAAVDE